MPRVALACALLLALPLVAPGAVGIPPTVTMYGTLESPVPIFLLTLAADPPPGPASTLTGLTTPTCSTRYFQADEAARSFTFREGEQENGCLGVRYNVTLPPGARTFEVHFEANRSVRQEDAVGTEAPNMEQVVRLLVDGSYQTSPVFGSGDPSRPPSPFSPPFDVPEGVTQVQVEWFFQDHGRLSAPGGVRLECCRRESFAATVWNPTIRVDRIPLAAPDLDSAEGALDNDGEYLARYTAAVAVPEPFRAAAAAGQFAITLEMNATLRPVDVEGPHGPLDSSAYATAQAGGTSRLILPAGTVQAHGGPFLVRFTAAEDLQRHGTFQMLSYVALAAPAIAIAAAWFGLRRTEIDTGLEAEA